MNIEKSEEFLIFLYYSNKYKIYIQFNTTFPKPTKQIHNDMNMEKNSMISIWDRQFRQFEVCFCFCQMILSVKFPSYNELFFPGKMLTNHLNN